MTIGDGLSVAKVYEFDTAGDGVTAGRVLVDISGATTAAEVAAILRTAILANQPALSVTDNADGTLTITHRWPGTGGNVTMTETVTHAGHTVSGLSGGTAAGADPYVDDPNDDDRVNFELIGSITSAGTDAA